MIKYYACEIKRSNISEYIFKITFIRSAYFLLAILRRIFPFIIPALFHVFLLFLSISLYLSLSLSLSLSLRLLSLLEEY